MWDSIIHTPSPNCAVKANPRALLTLAHFSYVGQAKLADLTGLTSCSQLGCRLRISFLPTLDYIAIICPKVSGRYIAIRGAAAPHPKHRLMYLWPPWLKYFGRPKDGSISAGLRMEVFRQEGSKKSMLKNDRSRREEQKALI